MQMNESMIARVRYARDQCDTKTKTREKASQLLEQAERNPDNPYDPESERNNRG